MDAVSGVAETESVGIVDRLVGCLQPVLTVLGRAAPKQHKLGILSIFCIVSNVVLFCVISVLCRHRFVCKTFLQIGFRSCSHI